MSLDTLKPKVEQLIEKAQWYRVFYEQSGRWTSCAEFLAHSQIKKPPKLQFIKCGTFNKFLMGSAIEDFDYLIETNVTSCNCALMFADTINLKHIVGFKGAIYDTTRMFRNSGIEVIDEPLDLSPMTVASRAIDNFNCNKLREIRFVEECLKISIIFKSPVLSAESKQSIFDGLAPVETAQTLTLDANLKILQSQVNSANAKGWTVAGGTIVSEEEYYG